MDRLRGQAVRLGARPRLLLAVALVALSNGATAFAAPPKKPAPKPAPAAPTPAAQATKSLDEGFAKLASGNYEGSLAVFKKLTLIEARRGAAQALDKLGRNDEAVAEYEAYIAGAPASADEHVRAARARVAELNALKAKAKVHVVTVPAGATVEMGGQRGTAPFDLEIPAGKYLVRATLAGSEPAEREVELAPGTTPQEVRLELAARVAGAPVVAVTPPVPSAAPHAAPPPAPAPPPPDSGMARVGAPIITGVIAGLSLGAGVYFGLSAVKKKGDYDDNPTPTRLASAETDAALSTAGLVGGVVLGVATVVLFLASPPPADAPPKAASLRANGLSLRF